jgi:hypothetical protein
MAAHEIQILRPSLHPPEDHHHLHAVYLGPSLHRLIPPIGMSSTANVAVDLTLPAHELLASIRRLACCRSSPLALLVALGGHTSACTCSRRRARGGSGPRAYPHRSSWCGGRIAIPGS